MNNTIALEQIKLASDKKSLELFFANGQQHKIASELLRVYSPSAEVRGHGVETRKIIGGKKNITISNIESVGNYAIRIIFADGHNTGIFTWQFLYELATNSENYFQQYIAELAKNNLRREN